MFLNLSKNEWELITKNSPEIFHRFQWQIFQEKLKNKVFQFKTDVCFGIAIEKKIKFIKYLYLPRSPYFFDFDERKTIDFFNELKSFAQKQNYFYLKIEPVFLNNELEKTILPLVFKNFIKILPHQPQQTIIVKTNNLEEAWKNLHSGRKYSIKKAKESNLKILKIDINHPEFEKYLKIFYQIHKETSKRGKFPIYSLDYFLNLSQCYDESLFWPRIYLAQFQQNFIAGDFFVFTPQRAFYLFAGFDKKFSSLQAPSLLIWEAIEDCFNFKIPELDLWGYFPEEKKRANFSKFKEEFGGQIVKYPGTFAWSYYKNLFIFFNQLKYLYLKIRNFVL